MGVAKPGARPEAEKAQQKTAAAGDEEDYEPLNLQSMDYEHMYTRCSVGVDRGRGNKEQLQQSGGDYINIGSVKQLDRPNAYTHIQALN